MIEEAVRARLIADAGVAAIVGDRVAWGRRPQGSRLTSIVLTLAADVVDPFFGGRDRLRRPLVQIDCWDAGYAGAHALGDAAEAALLPAASVGGVRFVQGFRERLADGEDQLVSGQPLFRRSLDLRLWCVIS